METVFHFLLPLLILLAIFPKLNRKTLLILSPLTILPDFDLYLGHRYLFHNIFFILLVSALVYVLFTKTRLNALSGAKTAFLIALFFLSSHIILDLGSPGVGAFYPVYDKLVTVDALVIVNPAQYGETHRFGIGTNPLSDATKNQDSPGLTTNSILVLAVLGIPLALSRYKSKAL